MSQTEIYNKYSWILFQLSNKYGNSSNYQDLFQEGFLALISCYEKFDDSIGGFDKFAKICVRNRMLNFLRGKQFMVMFDMCEKKPEYIWEYLPELTPSERDIFDLWSVGYTYKEISKKTGLKISKVNSGVSSILKKIRTANAENIDG